MTGALLVVGVLIAAVACPVLMWWRARRGHRASCCTAAPGTLDDLRRRRAEVDATIRQGDGAHTPDAA